MSDNEKLMQLFKQDIDNAWRDFKEATKGIATVASIRDAVDLRQLCEHRLSAFSTAFRHAFGNCKELQFLPEQVSDGVVDYGDLCGSRWVQGTEWILKLQALIDELCKRHKWRGLLRGLDEANE
jgi:hypothetical protein